MRQHLTGALAGPTRRRRHGTYCTTNTRPHHYDLAESCLADLGRVGFDDAGRTVELLVAFTHATLALRRSSPTVTTAPDRRQACGRPLPVQPGGRFYCAGRTP